MRAWLILVVGLGGSMVAGSAAATGGDGWPTLGHDALRSGRAAGKGAIGTSPEIVWERRAGGSLGGRQLVTADVNGDGTGEVVMVSAGRVVARSGQNTLLWSSSHIGAFAVVAVANLDGKGNDEVVALGQSPRGLYLLDAKSGATLWYAPTQSGAFEALAVPVPGGVRVLLAEQLAPLRAYGFAAGVLDPQQNQAWVHGASPWSRDLAASDVDGDGKLEVVRGRDKGFVVHDLDSGAVRCDASSLTAALAQPTYFPAFGAIDVDGDGRDEVVLYDYGYYYSEDASLYVVSCNGAGPNLGVQVRMQQQWVADVTPGVGNDVNRYQVRYLADGVADVDGKPGLEIAYSVWAEQQKQWTTYVRSAATGSLLASRAGEVIEALGDIDDDGRAELLLRDASGIADSLLPRPFFSTLRGYDLDTGAFVDKGWKQTDARVATIGAHHPKPVTPGAGAVAARQNVNGPGDPAIDVYVYLAPPLSILGNPAPGSIVTLHGSDGKILGTFDFPQGVGGEVLRLGHDLQKPGAVAEALAMLNDGGLRLLDDGLVAVGQLEPGNYARLPIVASLDGATNTIFAVESTEALVALDGTKLSSVVPVEEWRLPHALQPEGRGYVSAPGLVRPDKGAATAHLLVRAHLSSNYEEHALLALPAGGQPAWEVALGTSTFQGFDNLELLDDLDGDGTREVFVQELDADSTQLMVIRSGASGAVLVARPTADLFPPAGTFLQGHAALDVNGDGKLDVVSALHPSSFVAIDVSKAGMGNPATGFVQIFRAGAPPNGQAMATQLDPDPELDLVRHNAQNAFGAYERRSLGNGNVEASYLAPHPQVAGTDANNGAFVARPGSPGSFDLVFAGMAGNGLALVGRIDGASMKPVWLRYLAGGLSLPQAPIPSGRSALYSPIAADVDGDGDDEILVGSDDGYLYVLSVADGSVELTMQLAAPVVHVLAADVDKDPDLELLAALGNGRLVAIDGTGKYDADDVTPPPMPDAGPGGMGGSGGTPPGPGGAGGAGAAGAGGSASTSSTAGGAGGVGGNAPSAGNNGATVVDSGCGCRTAVGRDGRGFALALALLAWSAGSRRRSREAASDVQGGQP